MSESDTSSILVTKFSLTTQAMELELPRSIIGCMVDVIRRPVRVQNPPRDRGCVEQDNKIMVVGLLVLMYCHCVTNFALVRCYDTPMDIACPVSESARLDLSAADNLFQVRACPASAV